MCCRLMVVRLFYRSLGIYTYLENTTVKGGINYEKRYGIILFDVVIFFAELNIEKVR